ncbi:MAG: type I secretion system permease/ATPase [Alphaproteobacteria bacterium]|nr:MAG: type I secretion system permease/ATPase [Alphaproteobacteria bacterium]
MNSNAQVTPSHTAYQDQSQDSLQGCLMWLVKYYRVSHSLTTLVNGLPLVKNRLTPQLFARAAGRAGFASRVVRRGVMDIRPEVLPAVVMLTTGRAAILKERRPGKDGADVFVLIDTFSGDETEYVGPENFVPVYAGVMILVKETLRTQLQQELHSTAREWFWGTVKEFRPLYYKVGIAALVINLVALAAPLFSMNVYDRVVPNAGYATLWVLGIGAVMAYVFDTVFRQLRGYFVDVAGKGADILLASKIYSKLLNLRLQQQPMSAGAMANQLRDYDSLREFFTSSTIVAIVDVPFMFMFVFFIGVLGGPLFLLPLISIPVVLVVCTLLQNQMMGLSREIARESDMKHGHLVETINALENIKSIGSQSHAQGVWEMLVGTTSKVSGKIKFMNNLALNFAYLSGQIVYVATIIWGVYRVIEGQMTTGALVAASMLVMRAMAPVSQVASLYVRWTQTKIALETLTKFMQSPVEREDGKRFVYHPQIGGEIVFDTVGFAYPGSKLASLYQASFTIRPGEKVGIIGRAGSGKSTIARLVLGLYEPQEGRVRIDGLDLAQLDIAELRQQVCYFPQNLHLFRGTLRENLLMANPSASDADIVQAIEVSGAYRLVRRHPLGLDLPVGERGELLSGGQRQAIGLARALMREGRIAIFDDPTSEMDATSENWVKDRLSKWLKDRTFILITHRPSMLELVDRLIVVDDSRIIADGPKDRILAQLGVRAPVAVNPTSEKGA